MGFRGSHYDELNGAEVGRGKSSGKESAIWEIVSRVSDAEAVDPVELPPLAEALDPEALDLLLEDPKTVEQVSFEYCGRKIDVQPDGGQNRVEISDELQ